MVVYEVFTSDDLFKDEHISSILFLYSSRTFLALLGEFLALILKMNRFHFHYFICMHPPSHSQHTQGNYKKCVPQIFGLS